MAHLAVRKLWRLGGLIFPIIYLFSDSKALTLGISACVLIFFIILEIMRFLNSNFNVWLFKRFRIILKEEERTHILNTTFFLIFLNIAVWLFKKEIAIYSVFFVIFGDISASIIGRYFGHIRIRTKTLEGAGAFFISCLICGYLLNLFTSVKLSMSAVVPAALLTSMVELFSVIDDNLSVGLASCIVMEFILRIL